MKTVQEECIVIIQPEALENLQCTTLFKMDTIMYVCTVLLDTPLYAG